MHYTRIYYYDYDGDIISLNKYTYIGFLTTTKLYYINLLLLLLLL
jgi:hypothetical protein